MDPTVIGEPGGVFGIAKPFLDTGQATLEIEDARDERRLTFSTSTPAELVSRSHGSSQIGGIRASKRSASHASIRACT